MKRRALVLFVALAPIAAGAAVPVPAFAPVVGTQVDTGLAFRDETGRIGPLSAFTDGRPAVVLFGYDRCPGLCGVAEVSLTETLAATGLAADRYRVLFASIDPGEAPHDALAARAKLADALPSADLSGWRFLTGASGSVSALAAAAGLTVSALPGRDLYVHPVATLVLTPDSRIARAFGGLDIEARDLRLALVEASSGKLGTILDRLTLLCSGFDPATGRYSGAVMLGIRIGGIAGVVLLGLALVMLRRREAAR